MNINEMLTDEDRSLIQKLLNPFSNDFAKLAKRNSSRNLTEKRVSLADLSDSKLKELYPKVDIYIKERIELLTSIHKNNYKGEFTIIDESWILDYELLKERLMNELNMRNIDK